MEVKEAIELISQLFNSDWDNDVDENGISYKKTREDLISLLKSLEAENNKYKNILKELEQARGKRIGKNMSDVIDGFEKQGKKLDLEKRGLLLENKALKEENKAYKGMWKELKPTDNYECLILEERHLLSKMGNLENKYLGGSK